MLAELDCLLSTEVGTDAETALLDEVARGVYQIATFSASHVGSALEIVKR